MACVALAAGVASADSIRSLFGLHWNGSWTRKVGALLGWAIVGMAMAMCYRAVRHRPVFPTTVGAAVLLYMLIGAAEEFAYRGYVWAQFRSRGLWTAILAAAIAHTAYKVGLFVFAGATADGLLALAFWTLAGGILLGWLRWRSGGIVLPLAMHITFDAIFYGDVTTIPWWIW